MPCLYRNHQPQIPKELERLQVSAHPSMKAAGEHTPPSLQRQETALTAWKKEGLRPIRDPKTVNL